VDPPENKEAITMLLLQRRPRLAGAVLLTACLAGCGTDENGPASAPGGSLSDSNGPSKVSGTVVVDGSSTVYRISKAAQEGFESVNADVNVVVDNHGTGGGFGRYLQGEVDIVDASRAAKPEEESKAQARGIDWTRFLVGYDGITLVVNPKSTFVKSLTVDQLKKIWQPGSTVKTWKDVDPGWPDRKIIFYSPDNDSGTYEFFVDAIVGKVSAPGQAGATASGDAKAKGAPGKTSGLAGQRDGVQQSADDNTLVNGVANDEDGIGYFGYAYYAANKERLRALAVQNGPDAMPIEPSPKTILDKSYAPLSRPLYIYVKNSAARRPEVKQFITYYLDNVDKLSVKGGYDPPTPGEIKTNQDTLAKLLGGDAPAKKP
jgi:phosphate transport system substrate-binding protein